MSSESTESLQDPPGLPRTILHITGVYLLAAVGNLIWVPISVSPALLVLVISGRIPSVVLLSALLGMFVSTSMGSIGQVRRGFYNTGGDSLTDAIEKSEYDEIIHVLTNIGILMMMIIGYMSLLYMVAVSLAKAGIAQPALVAIFVPLADRLLLNTFDHSPVSLVVESFAKLVVFFGVVDDIDTTVLQHASPLTSLKSPSLPV